VKKNKVFSRTTTFFVVSNISVAVIVINDALSTYTCKLEECNSESLVFSHVELYRQIFSYESVWWWV